MSSEREVRNFSVESLRFPGEGSSAQGKSGPKLRPKGVDDGQLVEIPVLCIIRTVGTQEDRCTAEREDAVKHKVKFERQIRQTMMKCDED